MADEIMRQLQAVRIRERSVVVSTAMDEDDRRLSGRCRHPPRTQLDRLVGGPKLDRFERGAVVPWGLDEDEPIRSGSQQRWRDWDERVDRSGTRRRSTQPAPPGRARSSHVGAARSLTQAAGGQPSESLPWSGRAVTTLQIAAWGCYAHAPGAVHGTGDR